MERLRFALVVHPEPRKRIVVVSDPTEIDFAYFDGLAAQIALVGLSGPGIPVKHSVPAHDFFDLLCNTKTAPFRDTLSIPQSPIFIALCFND
jgi:hypothetical protein